MNAFSWETGSPLAYRAALERIVNASHPLGRERIAIEDAIGRVAARDLIAPIDIPAHTCATRDGFAVRAGDVQDADSLQPRQLRVVGTAFPDTPPGELAALEAGEALGVATGAPLPPGADTVVVVEKTIRKDDWVLISAPVRVGTGVMHPGGDVRVGTPIVAAGSLLSPPRLGLLATTGLEHIEVHRRPCLGIIATGDEFRESPPSNAITLAAWCARFGLSARRWTGRDSAADLAEVVAEAAEQCDALVTIGGTGPGSRDLVGETLVRLGWRAQVEGVRLRPGRTSSFGLLHEKPTFSLPGRPTANETAFLLLALPGLLRLAGARGRPFPEVPARLAKDLKRAPEQRRWTQAVKVRLYADDYFLHAMPLVGKAAQKDRGRLQAAAAGHGILLIEEGEAGLRAGEVLPVLLLERVWV